MTDRLTLARAFEAGGIPRDAAEHAATEIYDAIRETVATKADIASVKADIAGVRSDLRQTVADLKSDIRGWLLAQTFALLAVIGALHFIK
jgi:hypothetical protein